MVLIGGLRVAGESVLASDLGDIEIPRFELESDQNQIQIEFFGLGEGPGDELRYQYRLEGADRDWNEPTNQRSVNYASLSPGRYRFVVRAVATDGSVTENPARSLHDPSSIWQRTWFLTLAAILVTAGVYRCIGCASHNCLPWSGCGCESPPICTTTSAAACRALRSRVRSRVARPLRLANSRRGGSSKLPTARAGWSMRSAMSCGPSIREETTSRVCAVAFASTPTISWSAAECGGRARRHQSRIRQTRSAGATEPVPSLKEAVTNVARHASARSASMEFTLTNREFRAELRDDGRGFDQTAARARGQSDRHGIASMRGRAERLGGRLTIQSSPGIGTTVSVQMPLVRPWNRMTMLLSRRLR